MPQKQDQISYNLTTQSAPLEQLVNNYGDRLERLAACEKLHLLAVLAFWQAIDTEFQETTEAETYTLAEAVADYAADLPDDTLAALNSLQGVTDQACIDLMVAVAHQIRDGVFAS